MRARQLAAHQNVWQCLLLTCLWSMHFGVSVMVVFYHLRGLDQKDVFNVQVVILLAGVATGIVCGQWSDRYGVRKVTLVATILLTVHSVLFYIAHGPVQYQIVGFLLGLIWSFIRNATSTLMRVQLKDHPDDYKTYEQYAAVARNFGIVSSLAMGDVMVRIAGPELPFVWQPAVYGISAIIVWRIREVEYGNVQTSSAIKDTLCALRMMLGTRRDVRWFLVFVTVLHTTTYSSSWLFQPMLEDAGIATTDFSQIYIARAALVLGLTASASWYGRFSQPTVCALLLAVAVGSLLLAATVGGLIAPITLLVGLAIIAAVDIQLVRIMLAELMPTSRATELSVVAMLQALGFAIVSPFFGHVADSASTSAALLAIALFAALAGGVSVLLFRRGLS